MQVIILAAFMVVLSPLDFLAPRASWPTLLAALAGYIGISAALAAASAGASIRALRSSSRGRRIGRRVLAAGSRAWLVVGLSALIALGLRTRLAGVLEVAVISVRGWELRLAAVPLLLEVLLILPFVGALLLNWFMEYPYHRRLRQRYAANARLRGHNDVPIWSRRQFVDYNFRHQFLFIAVPVALIVTLNSLVARYFETSVPEPYRSRLLLPAVVAVTGGVFAAAPLLIVRIWKTHPLPDGPVRQRLEETLRRLKIGYRNLLVWESGGVIANAGVIGLIGPARYVLLTDTILERMDQQRLGAIFGHELGHIVSHHILYFGMFAVSSVLLATILIELIGNSWPVEAAVLAGLVLLWWLGFGWISRKFERQSDVIGAWSAGIEFNQGADPDRVTPEGAALFADALQQIAYLNNSPASQPNWRHGSIERRVSYILYLGSTGGTRRNIDRTVGRIKTALWLGLAGTLGLVATQAF